MAEGNRTVFEFVRTRISWTTALRLSSEKFWKHKLEMEDPQSAQIFKYFEIFHEVRTKLYAAGIAELDLDFPIVEEKEEVMGSCNASF